MHYPAPPHSLFAQLQSRFPTSSLVTELVHSQNGQYVVRALVQVGGTVLTTAMAAAATVEQAEEQARVRVLGVLGITPGAAVGALPDIPSLLNGTPLAQPSAVTESPSPQTRPDPSSEVKPEAVTPEVQNLTSYSPLDTLPNLSPPEELDSPEPLPEELEELPEEFSEDYDNGGGYEVEEFAPAIAEPALTAVPTGSTVTPLPSRPAPAKDAQPEPAIAPEMDDPEDLSFLIAQTDIEMDRIGWTKQEGREYLKRTYKKSTRQKLEVDELMDFLNYLRALPSMNGL